MNEKDIEHLQKTARQMNYTALTISFIFLICVAVFLFWFTTAPLGGYSLQETEHYGFVDMAIVVLVIPVFLSLCLYGLLYFLLVKKAYERYNYEFKQTYVLQTIQEADGFENLSYDAKCGLSYAEIYDSLVVACGEQKYFTSEDLLTGKIYGMSFAYGDVVTKYLRHHGKKSDLEIIFQGQIMRFSLPQNAKFSFGHMQIFEKEFLSNIKGRKAPFQIQTEYEAFNKRFEIYASDEHNAFYLLTPKMLEQIMRFADLADGQIALTFIGSFLYVAIHRPHSMFDASLTESFSQQKEKILQDIQLLQQAGELLVFEMNEVKDTKQL